MQARKTPIIALTRLPGSTTDSSEISGSRCSTVRFVRSRLSPRARTTRHRLPADDRAAWASFLACLACLIAVWSPLASAASASVTNRNVLVLYSNGRLLPANVEGDRALAERFAARTDLPVVLTSEFLDTPRFGGEAYERAMADFLREKYAAAPPEVVIAGGEEALDFWLRHRDALFPGVPIVHLGVPVARLEALRPLPPGVVGIPIDHDVAGTIEQALRWHPAARRLVFVTEDGPWGRKWERSLRALSAGLVGRVTVEFLVGLPTDELLRRLRDLPADTLVYSPGFYVDGSGRSFLPREAVQLIAEASAVPVYGSFSTMVGTGIVGGRMTGFDAMAHRGAEIVLALLEGAAPASLALPAVMPTALHLDWRQLRRWGIDPGALPDDAMVQFRTPSFWVTYGRGLLVAGAVVLLQAGFIAALLIERRRRKGAAAALMRSEQHMSLAARAAGLSMWVLDVGHRREGPRDDPWALAATAPVAPLDFAGTLEHIVAPDRDRVETVIRAAVASGEDFDVEYRIAGTDGSLRWQSARGRVDHGQGTRLIGVVSDITQRKQDQAEAVQAHAELQHMTRVALLGQLSASIAHQLNQPLASILGNAEAAQKMLERVPVDLAELRDICADIIAEDQRAAEVIRRLGALFRRSPPALAPLDINELVRDTVDLTRTNLLMHHVVLATALPPELPPLEGDRVQLQQMLLNLIVNAADAMSALPEPQRVMTISSALESGMIRLSVADRGPGIPVESMGKLFEPFWSTKADGMGIGLAVCRSIVAAHHGTLGVANAPDGGAVFCVRLPACTTP
jgi:signal transduction histidine kinase